MIVEINGKVFVRKFVGHRRELKEFSGRVEESIYQKM
jgi:hypothetical protein